VIFHRVIGSLAEIRTASASPLRAPTMEALNDKALLGEVMSGHGGDRGTARDVVAIALGLGTMQKGSRQQWAKPRQSAQDLFSR
jgi:hypothetical protein